MSRHILISLEALKEIIRSHKLQSPEFDESLKILSFIKGEFNDSFYIDGLYCYHTSSEFGYIYTKSKDIKKGVVFDVGNLTAFSSHYKVGESILVLQKTLKYALKFFSGQTLAPNERNINNDFTIIYPLPFTAQKNVFKVITFKNPLQARMDKRDQKYLYVFADGHEEISNIPPLGLFRRIIEKAKEEVLESNIDHVQLKDEAIDSLSVLSLGEITYDFGGKEQDEISKLYLTKKQKEFVDRPFLGCERLQGAAGTGKTVTLILRTIQNLKRYLDNMQDEKHLIFITHSISTKDQIRKSFEFYYPRVIELYEKSYSPISLTIITLQEWCLSFLGADNIAEAEYLDRDAQNSKELQLIYILEAYEKAITEDFQSYRPFCSEKFISFVEANPSDEILELLQSEIGVTIKGRARQDLTSYLSLDRLENSIPASCKGDFNFLFLVYKYYQNRLTELGHFDSDDIILSAIGNLSTPIWRRRRERDGYDVVIIDETHLFNINELSVIHHLTKTGSSTQNSTSIVFAMDKSQAVGDTGITESDVEGAFQISTLQSTSHYQTVFRSSPAIVNLAFSVLSSGTTLFTRFENPLEIVHTSFTSEEEKKCTEPKYIFYPSDEEMIDNAYNLAGNISKENFAKSRILLIATLPDLLEKMVNYAREKNKPVDVVRRRGDTETVSRAAKGNKFLLAGIDYVGGLEFDAVIITGVDEGRVPLTPTVDNSEGYHFNNHAWHNRLYVAITRARFQIYFLGLQSRGESPILRSAIKSEYLRVESK